MGKSEKHEEWGIKRHDDAHGLRSDETVSVEVAGSERSDIKHPL